MQTNQNTILMTLDNLVEGTIIKRPSKWIKTPYVADVIHSIQNKEIIAHSASLGCSGLAENGCNILMAPMPKSTKTEDKLKCEYKIFLSVLSEKNTDIFVGIHPNLAEQLAEHALNKNCLSTLQNVKSYNREVPLKIEDKVDSRFDFIGVDSQDTPFIMEIKNVPLADYEDINSKERKKRLDMYKDLPVNSKIAYFPDGYRKKPTDPISPRALKHIRELTYIKQKEPNIRCITCYVIQRNDVNCFQVSYNDPIYREAVKEAINAGVEIITLVVEWNLQGIAYFIRDDLPIMPIV
jgi:DNA-binding sugar fermentation-stimulating protein